MRSVQKVNRIPHFDWHFPGVGLLVRRAPLVSLFLCLTGISAFPLGGIELSLSFGLIALAVLSVWNDREWLQVWLLPPLVGFSSVCLFAGGIGTILLWLARVE